MTEKRSDYTGKYLLFLLGKLKSSIVLAVILSLCFYIPIGMLNTGVPDYSVRGLMHTLIGVGGLGIAALSFVTPLIAMRHLYTKTSSDNILSLPVTTVQRFLCEVGMSVAAYAVPAAVFMPLALIGGEPGGTAKAFIQILLPMISFTMFNIFLSCFCGRLAEAILYPIALNITVPLFFYLSIKLARSSVIGMPYGSASFSFLYRVFIGGTSPLGCFTYYTFMSPSEWKEGVITSLVMAMVFFALAFIVYVKRPAHNIGRTFVYKHAYIVNSLVIAVAATVGYISAFDAIYGYGGLSADPAVWIVLAVLLMILMLIMEFVNYKKINGIGKFLLKYAGALGAGVLISVALINSQGFGEGYYVPSADDFIFLSFSAHVDVSGNDVEACLRPDSELAEYIRGQHSAAIDRKLNGDPVGTARFSIHYRLKNGNIISREYNNITLPEDFFEKVITSPEYRLSPIIQIDSFIEQEKYGSGGEGSYINEPDGIAVKEPYSTGSTCFESHIDWKELREALYTDILNDTDYGRNGELPVCTLVIGRFVETAYFMDGEYITGETIDPRQYITIYEDYDNTLTFLRRLGKLPDPRGKLEELVFDRELISLNRRSGETGGVDVSQTVQAPTFYSSNKSEKMELVFITKEEFIKLFGSKVNYIYTAGQDSLYSISLKEPDFFDENGDGFLEDYIAEQLKESGMLESGPFIFDSGRGKYKVSDEQRYGNNYSYVLSEQIYGELEKYFTDGSRYVYRYERTYGGEPDNIGVASYPYPFEGQMSAVTTAIRVITPEETTMRIVQTAPPAE